MFAIPLPENQAAQVVHVVQHPAPQPQAKKKSFFERSLTEQVRIVAVSALILVAAVSALITGATEGFLVIAMTVTIISSLFESEVRKVRTSVGGLELQVE